VLIKPETQPLEYYHLSAADWGYAHTNASSFQTHTNGCLCCICNN